MATREERNHIINLLQEHRPFNEIDKLDITSQGIVCILRYLSEADRPVSAGEISEYVGVSSARVAVLIRKMANRNLITTGNDPTDARKTLVCISPKGREHYEKEVKQFITIISAVIDKIGAERLEGFIKIATDIKHVVAEELRRIEHNG